MALAQHTKKYARRKMNNWNFYGRSEQLAQLRQILEAGRWFFCRIEGRRRIGKTTLLSQLALRDNELSRRLVYMQVPDSDERDVAYTLAQSLQSCESEQARALSTEVFNFPTMAGAIGKLCESGHIIVMDEFQYFTRSQLAPFTSFLQAEVDKLRTAQLQHGGLFVLGSLHTEMSALLNDKAAPLYGRVTRHIRLDHWDFEDLLNVFEAQEILTTEQWLTLWSFFEGVPKFYHDAFEQDLFKVDRSEFFAQLLHRMFVKSSSPLSEEADTWFMRELRGKAVSILHYLAGHSGCSHAELVAALKNPNEPNTFGADLTRLVEHWRMVDKLNPVFSDSKSRNSRYYVSDNFLQAWLAVAKPAREEARLRPFEKIMPLAQSRRETLEGFAFEKLVRALHIECSKKGKGDFELSSMSLGYWNRPRDISKSIEIDVVALDEANKTVRFGNCKRNPKAHDLAVFERHVEAFLQTKDHKRLADWSRQMVLFSPQFSITQQKFYEAKGYQIRDLVDYSRILTGSSLITRPS